MKAMCEFFGVSRAAYYEWVKKLEKPDPDQEATLLGNLFVSYRNTILPDSVLC